MRGPAATLEASLPGMDFTDIRRLTITALFSDDFLV